MPITWLDQGGRRRGQGGCAEEIDGLVAGVGKGEGERGHWRGRF